jgi:putative transposase
LRRSNDDIWWREIPHAFPSIIIDEYVIMPDHFHGTIFIVGADLRVDPLSCVKGAHAGAPLHRIIQWFKTMTTNNYIEGVKEKGWKSFDRRLWQRNYYEHIIRNDGDLYEIRKYIIQNPLQWEIDRENSDARR